MLSKQGFFSRDNGNGQPSPSLPGNNASGITSSSLEKPLSGAVTPGHSAAMASATSSSAAVSVPAAVAGSAKAESKAETSAKSSASRLIVGPDVKLKGAEILDCDTLVVEGRVEATMDSRVLQIAADGSFSGKVGIDVAEIHGKFDGELTARSQLIIHATGRVSGKIRYGKIYIEEGGEVSGDVASLSSETHASETHASEIHKPSV